MFCASKGRNPEPGRQSNTALRHRHRPDMRPPPTNSGRRRDRYGRCCLVSSGIASLGGSKATPAHQVAALRRAGRSIPPLFLDVGENDPFGDQTRAFHAELEALGIAHSYAEWPGNHNWTYWRAHVGESFIWLI